MDLTPCRNDILAIVVTYNPGPDLICNLQAIKKQAESVLVIDNGSDSSEFVEHASSIANCRLIKQSVNRGVAQAFNRAIKVAISEKFLWVAMFDQDSCIATGAIAGLMDVYIEHPLKGRIGVIAMSHRDRGTGRDYHRSVDILENAKTWRQVRTTISSGSLVLTSIFKDTGLLDESLFIDCVDHDFCMRCREKGFLIVEGKNQVLDHAIGNATYHPFLGQRVACSNHSAVRRYYMTRNQLEIYRRYASVDSAWVARGLLSLFASSVVTLIFEKNRWDKLYAMWLGILHFALRRFGPLDRRISHGESDFRQ